jgi:hypothetical protein
VTESKSDANENLRLVKPDRGKSQARIDGTVALAMALDGYLRRKRKRETATAA